MPTDGGGPSLPDERPAFPQTTIEEILDVEKRRVDRDNRRTALIAKSFEFADERDRRQFDYATKAREDDMALRRAQSVFFRRLVWTLIGLGMVFFAALFALVFFGTEEQRTTASVVATPALIAIAGYGVIATLTRAMKSIINR